MRNIIIVSILTAFFFSCKDNLVIAEYKALNDGKWNKDDEVTFSFSKMDTISDHHIFINIRNDENYPFSNLFLIAELESPSGETVTDTLEYEMAKPNGEWLGKGQGSIKENKLWFKENIVFTSSGVYRLNISHAMRKNGKVEGVVALEGIMDVGFQIEKK